MKNALADPNYVIEEVPFNMEIVEAMRQVSRADVTEMPDRIVAATGLYFGASDQPRWPYPLRLVTNSLVAVWQIDWKAGLLPK